MKTGKKNKSERLKLVHTDVWNQFRYLHLVALIIMLQLLMMHKKKYGFISLDRNLMYFKLLRNENAWLKIRLVRN